MTAETRATRQNLLRMVGNLHLLLNANILIRARELIGDDDEVVGAEGIDLDLAELAGRDLVLEQDIEISVCETLVNKLAVV
jgi:hypothetical protein